MITKKFLLFCLSAILITISASKSFSQDIDEEYYESLLTKEVEVLNPVYKPVMYMGAGVVHFLGDIQSPGSSPLLGTEAYKAGVSIPFGKKNNFKWNVFVLFGGSLQGHDFEISKGIQNRQDLLTSNDDGLIFHNSSFKTKFLEIGVSAEYNFGHFFGKSKRFRPFISAGVAVLPITGYYTNEKNAAGDYYHFWDDGTIRNLPINDPNAFKATIVKFENGYEQNFSNTKYYDDLGIEYPQTSFVIPLEFGFDFHLSYRMNLRIATSLHYVFSDLLDSFNPEIAKKFNIPGNYSGNDMFMFTNVSLNFDLFSDPEMIRVERLFADITGAFDYEILFADQDRDQVFDWLDECPDTPLGVAVDSLGCPFDSDGDGIPDYLDKEPNTPSGAIVDESGVQLTPEALAQLFDKPTAVRREDVKVMPVAPIWTRNISFTPGVIPEKFKQVDKDGDGYISFQELMKAIESFFDGSLKLNVEEIYELNNYFFSQ
ncbi:MAG: hypothetical protein WC951_09085 [Bacteroidales bacterium]